MAEAVSLADTATLRLRLASAFRMADPRPEHGRVTAVRGLLVQARLPRARVGDLYNLMDPVLRQGLGAEVIGLEGDDALLAPLGEIAGISSRTEVRATGTTLGVRIGDGTLGSILDGLGRPIEGNPPDERDRWRPLEGEPPPPLSRPSIKMAMPVGVRAVDGLLTIGEGQRVGIFGPAGTGKSSLMGLLVQAAEVDVAVVGLIGERGREVREFVERCLSPETRERSVLVVATSDRPAIERSKAVHTATAIAEAFRDQGKRVLLVIDSLTRYARALREIGLAAGEPPTRRGYPPSLFARLPRLLERAGPAARGSITGVYAVLTEGDGEGDPVAEETQAILDGHIILSAAVAASGRFPAIDMLNSRSRVMDAVVSAEHADAARRLRALLTRYDDIELALQVGEYTAGKDPLTDEAVAKIEPIRRFLGQALGERAPFAGTVEALTKLIRGEGENG